MIQKICLALVCLLCISMTVWSQVKKRPVQISFVYPMGSNGSEAANYRNAVSVNILGGYSDASTAFEIGPIYNGNRSYTKGLQIAGIANSSGCGKRSVQIAGVTNVTTNQEGGVQFAGIANIASKGFTTVQIGGIFNYAHTVDFQFSGILNSAKDVKGVQLGLINICDQTEGVPLGLFNIVRHGGKAEFELAFSDAINTTLNFKFGTDHLYTILSGGITYSIEPCEYAVGLGLGTQLHWKKGWSNEFELITYSLTDNESFRVGRDMLTQARVLVSKQLAPHFKIFAGPDLDFSVVDNGRINHVCHYTLWQKTTSATTYKAWIGVSAGVRF